MGYCSRGSIRRRVKKNLARIGQRPVIDWAYIYWRLQTYFPHDPRFSSENFGFTPCYIIFQALEYGQRFYREDKHYSELGIATLTSYFVNANKDPKKGKKVSPADFFFFKPEDTTDIHPDVATTFFSLVSDRILPSWVASYIPLQELLSLKSRGKVRGYRALFNDHVVIICPELSEQHIFCGFILVHELNVEENPTIFLTNPDTGAVITIDSPMPEKGNMLTLVYSNYYVNLH